ncbi:MAG: V-type ATP synthase subunit E family protein [Candidatus Omnitrophica bacterium]|nr:V-type ATP synthase subunit E family protein [Candidatus Omnitrophota bacterium]
MSLDAIISHIAAEASAQKEALLAQARQEAERIIQEARLEAASLSRDILRQKQGEAEKARQKIIVAARLDARRKTLGVRQEIMEQVLQKLKSEIGSERFRKVLVTQAGEDEAAADVDFYLENMRLEHEGEISRVLFAE